MDKSLKTFINIFQGDVRRIVIPNIQRDYAQGRDTAEIRRVRTRFLDALYKAVTVTKMDGQDVRDQDSVRAILDEKEPGDTVELTIFRQSVTGKTSTFTVDVELAEDRGQLAQYNQQLQQNQNGQSQSGQGQYGQGQQGGQFPFFP